MDRIIQYTGKVQHPMVANNLALIVEDEKPLQFMYARSVQMQGYETIVADNGREALELLETHTPELIFLDMLLPYIGGEDILHAIANNPRFDRTHIVIMSSNIEFRIHQSIIPGSEFHLKPLLPSHIQAITTRLNKRLAS